MEPTNLFNGLPDDGDGAGPWDTLRVVSFYSCDMSLNLRGLSIVL